MPFFIRFKSIRYKVFFSILLGNVLLVASLYALSVWSFRHGFMEYLNRAEQQRLQPLVQALVSEHEDNGWQRLQHEHWRWRELMEAYVLGGRPNEELPDEKGPPDSKEKRPQPEKARKPPAPLTFDPRITLLDEKEHIVVGRMPSRQEVNLLAIKDQGKVIGYLGLRRHRGFSGQIESLFVVQQQKNLAWIMVGLLLMAIFVAFPLSSHLVKPVKQLLQATKKLIAGRFDARIETDRDDELGDLANDFNFLAKTLEENQAIRRQWIADIAHELRTPLAVLRGEIEALQDGIRSLDAVALTSLAEEARQLSALVDDLHELSLADLGGLAYRKEPVDLADIIESALETFGVAFAEANIEIQQDIAARPVLEGDYQRLVQLFNNLAQNTLRYTDAGGRLSVSLHIQAGMAQVIWSDSAPGVPDVALPHLFDRFYRVENRSRNRKTGGSGLGLAISQSIISAHNGKITAQHSPLGGLQLTILLPVKG